jgi:hypothetical protein
MTKIDDLLQSWAKQVVLTVVARWLMALPDDESRRRRNHEASESGIPKRKKTEAHTRLSCKIGYLLTSNPADQSTASEFFTGDELSRRL